MNTERIRQDAQRVSKPTINMSSEAIHSGEKLSEGESHRLAQLRKSIDDLYETIPDNLRDQPDVQGRCLELLSVAEQKLAPPITRKNMIDARLALTRLEIERGRLQSSRYSFVFVIAIIYIFVIAICGFIAADVITVGVAAAELNQRLIMGIPLPIWVWGVIGSLTSMLMRAGHYPFASRSEAYRWLMFRPVVGVIMGVLTYLMVTAGLIVFSGSAEARTPELLWIIAFIGSFSDNFSITLLQRVLGQFHTGNEAASSRGLQAGNSN